ncbi:MAG TPA: spore coat protein [Bacillus sp. (in: firmicutes)]|uniref:spore coat protein n=1 Tax=Bacillus litorisediminis TaxID=2922713 RepID=UPI001FAD84A1|nr:spore coat protein [Bacillus litorisediminis]HWO75266.1 spore coat protein [Bacillus sp. (in: firmicutes)]
MEQHTKLAFHETMDTHELINFKTICLMKSKLMQGICFDNDLKALMEKDVQQSIEDLKELKSLYEGARTHIS